jgi:hypothetical protein
MFVSVREHLVVSVREHLFVSLSFGMCHLGNHFTDFFIKLGVRDVHENLRGEFNFYDRGLLGCDSVKTCKLQGVVTQKTTVQIICNLYCSIR